MSNVVTIGNTVTKASLTKLSVDPELDGFMVVCFMKDKTVNVGWSKMTHEELAFGNQMLDIEVGDTLRQWMGDDDG